MFAVHTGARAGEQLAIEWGDLDWNNRKVVLRRSRSKGVLGPTKSGRERRVPMTLTLEAALKAMRHLKGDLVFCNPDGSPMTVWQLHERLRGARRRAGLRKVRWHDLRHSFGSQFAIAGVPVPQAQKWMGHKSIQTTMRYAHLAPGGRERGDQRPGLARGRGVATTWRRPEWPGNRPNEFAVLSGVPNGIRTRVAGLKGPCPWPG